MGTLYDLLGALPSDDADGLRAAFRRAAKATHPDTNSDDPESPRRFRELMRAYDILIDTDQRATYDELLTIALLEPPAAAKSTRVYERVRKYASNTMAATIISGLLVAGYTLFGHFSNRPGAAEFLKSSIADQSERTALAATPEADVETIRPAPPADTEAASAMIVTAALSRSSAPAGSDEVAHRFTLDNLWTRRDPALAVTYLNRDIILYRASKLDRAFDSMAQVRPAANSGRPKISAPASRRVSTVRIPEFREPIPLPPRRAPMIAALTP
jgi:curved DNA-binding protein CbpA